MSMPLPLAELGAIEKTVVTVLAVAGGCLLGFFAAGATGWGARRMMLRSAGPAGRLSRLFRLLGGAAGGIAAYLLLSGTGGFGPGGGDSGTRLHPGEGTQRVENPAPAPADKTASKKEANTAEELRGTPVSVYVLGVNVRDGRFFRLDEDAAPLTEEELIQRIHDLEKSGRVTVKQIRIKEGASNTSAVQVSKIYLRLRAEFVPLGFEIIPINGDGKAAGE